MQLSDFVYHSYDYRPNWTPLSPITIFNLIHLVLTFSDVIKTPEYKLYIKFVEQRIETSLIIALTKG